MSDLAQVEPDPGDIACPDLDSIGQQCPINGITFYSKAKQSGLI